MSNQVDARTIQKARDAAERMFDSALRYEHHPDPNQAKFAHELRSQAYAIERLIEAASPRTAAEQFFNELNKAS